MFSSIISSYNELMSVLPIFFRQTGTVCFLSSSLLSTGVTSSARSHSCHRGSHLQKSICVFGNNHELNNCLITPTTAASPSSRDRWKLTATIIDGACSFTIHTFSVFQKCPRSGSQICPLEHRVSFTISCTRKSETITV